MSEDTNKPKDVLLMLFIIVASVVIAGVVVALLSEIAWRLTEIFKG